MKKRFLFLLPMLTMALVFVTSCSKDDDLNVDGTNLVGSWAYVDEYAGKLGVPYYYTLQSDGTFLAYEYWGSTAYYKDGYVYSNATAKADMAIKCEIKGNSLYSNDGIFLARIDVIDDETIRIRETTFASEVGIYKRIKGFRPLYEY